MENITLIFIIICLFLLIVITGLLSILIYKLIKERNLSPQSGSPHANEGNFHPIIRERLKELHGIKKERADIFCLNHKEEPGEVNCSICEHIFCKSCIKNYKSLYFCKEHIHLVMKHDWVEVLTVKTSTNDPEKGVRLYDLKKAILEQDQIPSFIETHYKINIDQDHIETYLVLFSIKENAERMREKLKEFNN